MLADPSVIMLMYFVLPLWLLAGFSDWLCHRHSQIETTTGAKESLIHLLMFVEMGIPLWAAIFLQVNAGIILLMAVAFFVHEATALWDVTYAMTARHISPIEQHVHSFLELVPLIALVLIVGRHWPQASALLGMGTEPARFDIARKTEPLPGAYVASIFIAVLFFDLLPYLEELVRGLRANGYRLVPQRARSGRH